MGDIMITIDLDDEELRAVVEMAEFYGKSVTDVVRDAIRIAAREQLREQLREEVAKSVNNPAEQRALREEFEAWRDTDPQ
ncbi:hypothetical protein QT969_10360 [Rhodococcus sp. CSLK01-03]|uniref:Ribbon-helix-helix protein, copG family n=1 Tax=Rhodococcus indonesiensis TaxID=3055869 RepID=A0ABT7RM26_9NOCA|nr:hypothetical protein [Rhodococcus indonesiensis]MDM7488693.1 hypothetical protein [Rhodococcus indonesiensis]